MAHLSTILTTVSHTSELEKKIKSTHTYNSKTIAHTEWYKISAVRVGGRVGPKSPGRHPGPNGQTDRRGPNPPRRMQNVM